MKKPVNLLAILVFLWSAPAIAEGVADCTQTLLQDRQQWSNTVFSRAVYNELLNQTHSTADRMDLTTGILIGGASFQLGKGESSSVNSELTHQMSSDVEEFIKTKSQSSFLTPINAQIYQACVSGVNGGPVVTARRASDAIVEVTVKYKWVKDTPHGATFKILTVNAPPSGASGIVGSKLEKTHRSDDERVIFYKISADEEFLFTSSVIETHEQVSIQLPAAPKYRVRAVQFSRTRPTQEIQYGAPPGRGERNPASDYAFSSGPINAPSDGFFIDEASIVQSKSASVGTDYGHTLKPWTVINQHLIKGTFQVSYGGFPPFSGGILTGGLTWNERFYVVYKGDKLITKDVPNEVMEKL